MDVSDLQKVFKKFPELEKLNADFMESRKEYDASYLRLFQGVTTRLLDHIELTDSENLLLDQKVNLNFSL